MQIFSDHNFDQRSATNRQGSYEWWYFDALTTDGEYGFVIIFYANNPFSRRYVDSLDIPKQAVSVKRTGSATAGGHDGPAIQEYHDSHADRPDYACAAGPGGLASLKNHQGPEGPGGPAHQKGPAGYINRTRPTGRFPALSITIYRQGSPIYYGFREHEPGEASFSSNMIFGKVGKSRFTGGVHSGAKFREETRSGKELSRGTQTTEAGTREEIRDEERSAAEVREEARSGAESREEESSKKTRYGESRQGEDHYEQAGSGKTLTRGLSSGDLCYRISIDQQLPGGDRISGNLEFASPGAGVLLPAKETGRQPGAHTWNLVQPRAAVSGELHIDGYEAHTVGFEGQGYHDHNFGTEPMDHGFIGWYWGRFHFSKWTLVYYIMAKKNGDQQRAWLIDKSGNTVLLDRQFALHDKSLNKFGLRSARKIEIAGKRVKGFIQQEKVIDNGPFYQRFQSKAILDTQEGLNQAIGISEYIQPVRIRQKVFRPLVNMRIDYPDEKAHWVQRNPRLYRWTW